MGELNLDPLARPLWRGRTNVDQITIAAIEYAETLRRNAGTEFTITQGSYQAGSGDPNSAGTHDLGGVVDIRWTGDDHDVWALRAAGFAAWHRTPAQGPWPDHIHAVLVGHPYLAPLAAQQVEAYRDGRNGLANNGPDDGPRITPIPVFDWPEDWIDMATEEQITKLLQKEVVAPLRDSIRKYAAGQRELVRGQHKQVVAALKGIADEQDDAARKVRLNHAIQLINDLDASLTEESA